MENKASAPSPAMTANRKKTGPRPLKELWRRIRKPLAKSRFVKQALATLMAGAIRLIDRTNPRVE